LRQRPGFRLQASGFIANYIDRVNVGFVRTHLEADVGIGAAAFGLGAVLFVSDTRCSRCPRT
jgi:hypothetical protein